MKRYNYILLLIILLSGCTSHRSLQKVITAPPQFSVDQVQLIMAADSMASMRILQITNTSDSLLLRSKSEDVVVDPADTTLRTFVKRLYQTVTDPSSMGVGIAAPQVGILKNIIWVQRFDKPEDNFPFEVYLNPKIVKYSKLKQNCLEGCLSIPERSDTTKTRSYAIMLEYDNMQAEHKVEMIEDFTAVIFQHEIDHLNGILYLDHLQQELKDAKKAK